ncbi:uncharacterized protein [Heptranchias perlo]|uniref:uncharacterized protein isoform X2 n=1 Tax=Heptranchias perlo TaxID=212740 RepID=UPI00355A72ED
MFGPTLSAMTLLLCVTVGLKANLVLIQSPEVVKVSEGQTVQSRCVMESGNVADSVDKSDVHWYHPPVNEQNILMSLYVNGKVYRSRSIPERFQLARDVASNAYILTITDVRLSDTADYICGIWGKIFGTGTRLNVTSANAPVIIQSPSLERVTEGQTARLQCTMRKATVRDTDVHWYRQLPGQDMEWVLTHDVMNNTRGGPGFTDRFQPSRDIANNSFILTITNVQPNDTAVYYCKVWGDISGNGTQLNITSPLADPVLAQYPTVSKVPEGETIQLQCAMYNASVSDTDAHWYYQRPGNNSKWLMSHFVNGTITRSQGFPDRFQPSRNVTSNSYILTIMNVSLSDTAVYNCSVWSYIYGAGTQLNVTVANAPVIIQSPSLEGVTEGQTARLQCTIQKATVRDTDVHWYRQLPGQDMEWVLTHDVMNNTRGGPGFTDRFQPSRDIANNSFILAITNVQPNDTAVYYCKVWGDISGNGTQLNITKRSEKNWHIISIIAVCALVLIILLCILITVLFYVKRWACFQSRLKPEGTRTEDVNVDASVNVETRTNKQAAAISTASEEGEMYYADIQFLRQNTGGPTLIISEETTEYAAIKRA